MSLHEKLAAIQGKLGAVPKSGKNTFARYEYATEGDVLEVLRPLCAEHKLSLVVSCIEHALKTVEVEGKTKRAASVVMELLITDAETGEVVRVIMPGYAEDSADKALYKAITGASKYLYWKGFALATGDDPESNGQSKPVAKTEPQKEETTEKTPHPHDGLKKEIKELAKTNGWQKEDFENWENKNGKVGPHNIELARLIFGKDAKVIKAGFAAAAKGEK